MRLLLLLGGLVVLVAACGSDLVAQPTATPLFLSAAAPTAVFAAPTATSALVTDFDPTDPEIVFGDKGSVVTHISKIIWLAFR